MKIVIAASGDLGISTLEKIKDNLNICGILTDSLSVGIINFAKSNNIPTVIGNPRNKKTIDELHKLISNFDLLISINYLYILPKDILDLPKLLSLNIHGSLLPKYRGRTPHVWAIINGEKEAGVTVHKIDEGCDTGDILIQKKFEISSTTTGGDLLKKFREIYPELILSSIELIKSNNYAFHPQNHQIATYFPKRTPQDGEIDWSWSGLRISNWIRALTKPYPGAFTFINGKKVLIWSVELLYNISTDEPVGSFKLEKNRVLFKCSDCFVAAIDYEIKE